MKLIDILVQELPGRGGWPKGANFISSDSDGYIDSYINVPVLDSTGCNWRDSEGVGYFRKVIYKFHQAAIDWETAIITREQYEAALAAKNEGWIEWGGGKCPVEKGVRVDVKYRDGDIYQNKPALGDRNIRWSHVGSRNGIVAYRLHKSQEAAQTKTNDKADLNECIGKDAAPVWSGEGLPPVGCDCEFEADDGSWGIGTVICVGKNRIFWLCHEDGDEYTSEVNPREFRPLRTETERKREAAIKELTSVICGEIPDTGMATAAMYAARIYDAGYRKDGE